MKENRNENELNQKPAGGISVSIALCFLVFLYAPLEIYFSNISEFWFDFPTMFPVAFITFVIMLCVCCLIFGVLKRIGIRVYQLGVASFFIIFICTYIQGNFLLGNLPPLDGTEIDWNMYKVGRIETVICWSGVLLVVFALIKLVHWEKFCQVVKVVGGGMTLLLVITIISLGIMTGGFSKKLMPFATTEGLYELSDNNNFIIFLLDAVDAGEFSNVMEKNPESISMFDDFTYYENTVGGYPCTKLSIPFIISGEWFENEIPFEDYLIKAYKNAPIIQKLDQAGYRMNFYEDGRDCIPDDGCIYKFENFVSDKASISSKFTFAKWQILLSGFKYAPFDFKRFCLSYPEAFQELMLLSTGYSVFTCNNLEFYEGLQGNAWTHTGDKCFKFIHIEGGHVPFRYNKNVQLIENGTYEDNLEACITITKSYLDKLKEMGVYDESVIIIMADHGFIDLAEQGRQNPILFIKGVGEKHELRVSQAPISYEDLQEAYLRLLNGKQSGEVFDYKEEDKRERRYLFYNYLKESHLYEYVQTGEAGDESTMKATGREFVQGSGSW